MNDLGQGRRDTDLCPRCDGTGYSSIPAVGPAIRCVDFYSPDSREDRAFSATDRFSLADEVMWSCVAERVKRDLWDSSTVDYNDLSDEAVSNLACVATSACRQAIETFWNHFNAPESKD